MPVKLILVTLDCCSNVFSESIVSFSNQPPLFSVLLSTAHFSVSLLIEMEDM